LGHKVKVSEGNYEPFGSLKSFGITKESLKHVSRIYNNWEHLFQEKETIEALSKHQSWDHEIRLELGKQLTFEPIYALFEKKLEVLREYLTKNEKKEFIRKS